MKNKNGITLIALVITIVVLIILAGVSINIITGDNGLITKTKEASKKQEIVELIEKLRLDILDLQTEKVLDDDEMTTGDVKKLIEKNNYGSVVEDDEGNIVSLIPVGKTEEEAIDFKQIYSENIKVGQAISKFVKTILKNPSEYYGKKVKYTGTEAIEKYQWQIFYADENYVYLTTNDFVNDKYWIKKDGTKIGRAGFSEAIDQYEGMTDITDPRLRELNKSFYDAGYTGNTINGKSVAYMMDTEVWNQNFKSGEALYAIGGPSIELFVKSYNKAYNLTGNKEMKAKAFSEYGYKVSIDGGATWEEQFTSIFSVADVTDKEKLYVRKYEGSGLSACWIASGAKRSDNSIIYINCINGGIRYNKYNVTYSGFRPIVCFSSSTEFEFI